MVKRATLYRERLSAIGPDKFSVVWRNRDTWDGDGIFLENETLDVPDASVEVADTGFTHSADVQRYLAIINSVRASASLPDDPPRSTRIEDYAFEPSPALAIQNAIVQRLWTLKGEYERDADFGAFPAPFIGRRSNRVLLQSLDAFITGELAKDSDWYSVLRTYTRFAPGDKAVILMDIVVGIDELSAPISWTLVIGGATPPAVIDRPPYTSLPMPEFIGYLILDSRVLAVGGYGLTLGE